MLTVVLTGPHAVGKSSISFSLSSRYGWRCHDELGDRMRSDRTSWGAVAPDFDNTVLEAEATRDEEFHDGFRVVETWHSGNLAWAELRLPPSLYAPLCGRTDAAVAAAVARGRVIVQPLTSCAEVLLERRRTNEALVTRVPSCAADGNNAERVLVEKMEFVASRSLFHAARCGLRILPAINTEELGSPAAAAEAVFKAVLAEHLPPAVFPSAPLLYATCADAARCLAAAAALDPSLAAAPGMRQFLDAVSPLADAGAGAGASPVLPFIAVEGLDGVGKSELVRGLAARLRAAPLRTPPADAPSPPCSPGALRPLFDASPPAVARAYYMACNALVARAVAALAAPPPDGARAAAAAAVCDRYWFSTAAYTLAKAGGARRHPPAALAWPRDLPRPALVLWLRMGDGAAVDREAARLARLNRRGAAGWGPEEAAQAADPGLAGRVDEAYALLVAAPGAPCCTVVDACGTIEEVLRGALAAVQLAGLAVPTGS